MKRLLLLLLLPCAAFAQTNINVSITYTPGAAAAATAQGTTITAKVNSVLGNINGNYGSSSIGVNLVSGGIVAAGNTAPADSAPMSAQYAWVHNNPFPWQVRTNADASISVHVSDTPGAAGAVIAGNQPASPGDAVVAVPYSMLDSVLERAISRIIGSTTGYAKRMRSYPTDPILQGQNYCYHTQESDSTDPNEQIPLLPYWSAYTPLGVPIQQTQSASNTTTCEAFRLYLIANGGSSTADATATVSSTGGTYTCTIRNNTGGLTAGSALVSNSNPGSSTIACAETGFSAYSINGNMWFSPFLPLGNSTTDSVSRMNARVFDLSISPSRNATITAQKKAGFWSAVCYWITCPF